MLKNRFWGSSEIPYFDFRDSLFGQVENICPMSENRARYGRPKLKRPKSQKAEY